MQKSVWLRVVFYIENINAVALSSAYSNVLKNILGSRILPCIYSILSHKSLTIFSHYEFNFLMGFLSNV